MNASTARVDMYEELIVRCETREGAVLPDRMRRRLAAMWRRSVEKAFVAGWHRGDEALNPALGDSAVVRAAERALNDDLC